jgi:hypothetical protein
MHAPDGQPIRLGAVILDPKGSAAALIILLHPRVEAFGILCLTTKHRVICWHEVGRGSLDSVIVMPFRVIVKTDRGWKGCSRRSRFPTQSRESIACGSSPRAAFDTNVPINHIRSRRTSLLLPPAFGLGY